MRVLVDPKMTAELWEGFFASRVTIQDEFGVPVHGLIDIPCADGPGIIPPSSERRTPDLTIMSRERNLLLPGLHTQIREHWRAVVEGIGYDILAVEHSSSRAMTKLRVEATAG